MSWTFGVLFFFLFILVSVALHECGHMWVARATGMKVRRYFVGFGPTLWSTRRPNKIGSTEYGVKAIPLGGFCDIAGMTSIEELQPGEEKYAMYKQSTWKRVAVLLAGPAMNILIGLVIVYAIAISWGLPSLHAPTAVVGETRCVQPQIAKTGDNIYGPCPDQGPGPAALAGIRAGDTIVEVDGKSVATFADAATAIQAMKGSVPIVYERDGQRFTTTVDVAQTQRFTSADAAAPATVGAIGISAAAPPGPTRYNPVAAVPATLAYTGDLSVLLVNSLAKIPTKLGALVHSLSGGERDPETPISIVGASIIGGDSVEHGLWVAFFFFLAQLNFVLGAVNLIPLLPLDGGHIAVAVYEKIRNMIRLARGKVAAAPVNYLKLMPLTYVVVAVLLGFTLLTVTADFINPIRPFQ